MTHPPGQRQPEAAPARASGSAPERSGDKPTLLQSGPAAPDPTTTRRARVAGSVEDFIWSERPEQSRWRRYLVQVLRLVWAVSRDLAEGQLTLRAMSLVYTTLLSLVPLLAIAFSMLKGFGLHNQIEPLLQNAFEPLGERRDEVVERIIAFVDNVQVGVLGTVGFILLFYTTLSLLQKIEQAFTEVWQTTGARSFTERFRDYLTVIIVGPLLVFVAVGLSVTLMSEPWMQAVSSIRPLGWFIDFLGWMLPIVVAVVAFTFFYLYVPNTRVRWLPALTGGLVAGVLWNGLGWLFAGFVAHATRYTAIYSGFATPILFMIWLYVGWLIMLIGANIAFYRQHPEYLAGRRLADDLSASDRERLALRALCVIGERFYGAQTPPDSQHIARLLRVPEQTVQQLLTPLEETGLLASTATAHGGYLPACPWEQASVYEVLQTLHESSNTPSSVRASFERHRSAADRAIEAMLKERERASRIALDGLSLKQLVTGTGPGVGWG
jgi:membrane protein